LLSLPLRSLISLSLFCPSLPFRSSFALHSLSFLSPFSLLPLSFHFAFALLSLSFYSSSALLSLFFRFRPPLRVLGHLPCINHKNRELQLAASFKTKYCAAVVRDLSGAGWTEVLARADSKRGRPQAVDASQL
jgi:hypothetical protein